MSTAIWEPKRNIIHGHYGPLSEWSATDTDEPYCDTIVKTLVHVDERFKTGLNTVIVFMNNGLDFVIQTLTGSNVNLRDRSNYSRPDNSLPLSQSKHLRRRFFFEGPLSFLIKFALGAVKMSCHRIQSAISDRSVCGPHCEPGIRA